MKHILNGLAGFVFRFFLPIAFTSIVFLILRVIYPDKLWLSLCGIWILMLLLFSVTWEIFISAVTSDDRIESKGKIIYDEKHKPRWRH